MLGEVGHFSHRFPPLLGKRNLIMGEVGSGKTRLMAELLEEAVNLGYSEKIAVIDLSPNVEVSPGKVVGAPLADYVKIDSSVKVLRPLKLRAPRLEGKSGEEVIRLAEENARAIEKVFSELLRDSKEILFVNDVSVYLHRGSLEKLLSALSRAKTWVLTGYYGNSLNDDKGSGVSSRERALMMKLAESMDNVIEMNHLKGEERCRRC
jgi:hypothetical protein